MSAVIVSTTAALLSALHSATAGETIELAPGTYDGVNLPNFHPSGTVTITSEYSWRPASITNLVVNQSSNLAFRSLDLNATSLLPGAGGGNFTWVATVEHSTNVTFANMNVYGHVGSLAANAVSGINFTYDTNVTLSNSTFKYLYNGVDDYQSSNFNANGNSFDHIFTDGIHGGGVTGVHVTNNTFTNIHEDLTNTDHPDAIQFFNVGTYSGKNIYIANNTYTRGDGAAAQGIFLNDQYGNSPFQSVTIINNNLTGSLWRGISIQGGLSVNVSGNDITSYQDNWSAVVLQGVTNASVTNNTAFKFTYQNDLNLNAYGNVLSAQIQDPYALAHPNLAALQPGGSYAALQSSDGWELSLGLGNFGDTFAVPEPATWALMLIGVAAAGAACRLQRHRARSC